MSEFADGLKQGMSFVIKNVAPQNKRLKFFNHGVANGSTLDLMQIPGVSEDDIKASILKGDLGRKLNLGYVQIETSTLNFEGTDPTYTSLLTSFGLSASTRGAGGGIGTVNNVAALTIINDINEVDGAERQVNSLLSKFVLDKSSTETIDNITVLATNSGVGRWLRAKDQHPRWTKALNWYVDPVSGNDENTGTVSNSPLKTMRETARRLTGFIRRDRVNVNLLNNVTDANDLFLPDLNQDNTGTFGGQSGALSTNIALCIQGVRTTATFTDPNTSSTTALTMTSAATAPSLISGVAGLPGTITVTGLDFTPHVGRHIEILTSSVSASIGSVAVIVAAPSLGVAWISPLITWPSNQTTPSHTTLSSAQYPSSSSTFRIYTNTTYAPHVLSSTSAMNNAAILFQDIELTTASAEVARAQNLVFNGCMLRRVVRPSAGGEQGPFHLFVGCSFNFSAPAAGRTPTQLQLTSGETRFGSCGFINVDLRVREADAKCIIVNCVMDKSMISLGGPNDVGRVGSPVNLVGGPGAVGTTGSNYGLGMFNWPGPDLLPPSPPLTRSSSGAAIHVGHGSKPVISGPIYGNCATAGTVGIKIQEGAQLLVSDQLTTSSSPVNPPAPYPGYIANSLKMTGVDGDFHLDGYTIDGYSKHITYSNLRGVLSGTVVASPSLFETLNSWADWENPSKFNRNAFSLVTGAGIIKIET